MELGSKILTLALIAQMVKQYRFRFAVSPIWWLLRWQRTYLALDVISGNGGMFSLKRPTGQRFIVRSRLFTEEKSADLAPVA